MQYDPNRELNQEQLDRLAADDFDAFLNYLDDKAAYLKKFSAPLRGYEHKRYAALTEAISKTEKSKVK